MNIDYNVVNYTRTKNIELVIIFLMMIHTTHKIYYQNYTLATTRACKIHLKYNTYYALVYIQEHIIYILSMADIKYMTIDYLYHYTQYIDTDYSYSVIILMTISFYTWIPLYLDLQVFSLNQLALSLYIWIGYSILISRCIIIKDNYKNILVLKNTRMNSKNYWRRYLLLKYLS